jgi:hypothetical protein
VASIKCRSPKPDSVPHGSFISASAAASCSMSCGS